MIRPMLTWDACGSCPASPTGTLLAIEGMLQKEVDPELVVISVWDPTSLPPAASRPAR
jgi:Fe-S cluster biogenesis protein NfuA